MAAGAADTGHIGHPAEQPVRRIRSSSSLVSASGTDLTISLGLGLQGTYLTTAEKVYLWVQDNEAWGRGGGQAGHVESRS